MIGIDDIIWLIREVCYNLNDYEFCVIFSFVER